MCNIKHGLSKSKVYNVYRAMINRCNNPKNNAYIRYGGRGIKICERWMKFEYFIEDMGVPENGLQLERINNNGNYEKCNCYWATRYQQGRNKRNNVLLTVDGETKTLSEWAILYGLKIGTVWTRIKLGWSEKDAVKLPLVKHRKGIKRGEQIHQAKENHSVEFAE